MNIFYAKPEHIHGSQLELTGQEAKHAARVLRYREGDPIVAVDGRGRRYEGIISRITERSVQVQVEEVIEVPADKPDRVLAMGLIKKRDRLEFAVEKAVELGASEIVLFRSRHTVKENVRMDRLEMTALSAMKQSLRARLPEVRLMNSLEDVMAGYKEHLPIIAHMEADKLPAKIMEENRDRQNLLLLVGPEGGLSGEEVSLALDKGAKAVTLGDYRLRAETAAIVMLSRFNL